MTDFTLPENIKNEALMINALHYMATTSETSFEYLSDIIFRNANGETITPSALHKILMHIGHQYMTFNLLCEEVIDEFMADSREFSMNHQGHKDEIQEQLKAHPFMQKMMQIVSEDSETRALRLVVDTGMPDDLADAIRQMMKHD